MENDVISISNLYNCLFENEDDKKFFENLLYCLITDKKPKTTPALWQDVEIFMRYKKRDVWSINQEHRDNVKSAMAVYRLKYILEHLKKSEILAIIKKFLAQDKLKKDNKSLIYFFNKKFLAPVDDLMLTHEKNVVAKDMICDFDKFFEYPSWIEFDDEAMEKCFDLILKNKMSDEQIRYFLGANDDMKHYDRWFEVAKHVLLTANSADTFWIAGDILNIVWKAVPDDEKLQKWFRDQVFEIFWPRVKSVWPMINKTTIDFSVNDEMRITLDSIGWLGSLVDLRERLPELPEGYELNLSEDDDKVFEKNMYELLASNDGDKAAYVGITQRFFDLADMACSEKHLEDLEYVKDKMVEEFEVWSNDSKGFKKELDAAIKHAKKYVGARKREGGMMAKYIEKQMKNK